MIKVDVLHSKEKTIIEIDGHAGYSDYGKDIVCAGASVLYFTLAQYLLDTDRKVEITGTDGHAKIIAPTDDGKILDSVDAILTGYRMLAKDYSDYVEIEEKELT